MFEPVGYGIIGKVHPDEITILSKDLYENQNMMLLELNIENKCALGFVESPKIPQVQSMVSLDFRSFKLLTNLVTVDNELGKIFLPSKKYMRQNNFMNEMFGFTEWLVFAQLDPEKYNKMMLFMTEVLVNESKNPLVLIDDTHLNLFSVLFRNPPQAYFEYSNKIDEFVSKI